MNAQIRGRLALLLAAALLMTAVVGCGGAPGADPDSSAVLEEDDFSDTEEYIYDASDDTPSGGSGESAAPTKSGSTTPTGAQKTVTTTVDAGPQFSDNNALFKNIPAAIKGSTVSVAVSKKPDDRDEKVQALFTKTTGIKVDVSVVSGGYVAAVAKLIAAGQGPDLITCTNTYPRCLEITQPLPKIFNVNDGFWDKRISEATRVGGKYYYVNAINSPSTGGYVVYYNKSIFDNNGLTTPEDYFEAGNGHWTYEQMYRCMEDVANKTSGNAGGILECLTLAGQMGVSPVNYNSATATFSSGARSNDLVAAIQYMAQAVEDGLAGGVGIGYFSKGNYGIGVGSTGYLKYNSSFADLGAKSLGVVPLPDSYRGKTLPYMPLGFDAVGIAKGARNPDGAYYWARWSRDLDKYDEAGAELFLNRAVERYYRHTQLVQFQKSKLYFEFYQGAMSLIGKGWSSAPEWATLRHSAVDKVGAELLKNENTLIAIADAANKVIKENT